MRIDDLSDELNRTLSLYSSEIQKSVNEAVRSEAKELQKNLKRDSPKRAGGNERNKKGKRKKPGSYAKGWRVRDEVAHDGVSNLVYNATDWQLTHLLEYGHANRGGGRTPAKPHIAQNRDIAAQALEEKVRELIGNT